MQAAATAMRIFLALVRGIIFKKGLGGTICWDKAKKRKNI